MIHESMNRRQALKTLGAVVGTSAFSPPALAKIRNKRPNVIVVVLDDCSLTEVGYHEKALPEFETPFIDSLCQNGVRFRNGFSSDSVCWPSRGAILTGRFPQRWDFSTQIDLDEPLMSDYFKNAGYATAAIGKWHNGHEEPYRPVDRNFDRFFGFLKGAHSFIQPDKGFTKCDHEADDWIQDNHNPARPEDYLTWEEKQYIENTCGPSSVVDGKFYATTEFTAQAIDFIDRQNNNPFLLYLAYNALHVPLTVPLREFTERFGEGKRFGKYLAASMMEFVDKGMKDIVDRLKSIGQYENTMIVFTGDNGKNRNNPDVRGTKGTLYDGGLRVPFFVHWAGTLSPMTYDGFVTHTDIVPTILSAAGINVPDELDGTNLLPFLQQSDSPEPAPQRTLFWGKTDETNFAVRDGKWKLIKEDGKLSLFDMNHNPEEKQEKNLLQEKPEVVARLQNEYDAWVKKIELNQKVSVHLHSSGDPLQFSGIHVLSHGPGGVRIWVPDTGKGSLKLFSLNGKITAGPYRINSAGIATIRQYIPYGIYTVRISTDKNEFTAKIKLRRYR